MSAGLRSAPQPDHLGGQPRDAGEGVVQAGRAALPFGPELEEAGLGHAGPVRSERPDAAGELTQRPVDAGGAGTELCRHLLKLLRGDPDPDPSHAPSSRSIPLEDVYLEGETMANRIP